MPTILATLKRVKHVSRKIENQLRAISRASSIIFPSPEEIDGKQIDEHTHAINGLRSSVYDLSREKLKLLSSLQRTNATIIVPYKGTNYTLQELIMYRDIVLPSKILALKALTKTDKGYTDGKDARVVLCYSPDVRDSAIDDLSMEILEVDSIIDVANSTNQIID